LGGTTLKAVLRPARSSASSRRRTSGERCARRDELILSKAYDMAIERIRIKVEGAKIAGVTVTLPDTLWLVEGYIRMLRYVMRHGKLPPDAERELERWKTSPGP